MLSKAEWKQRKQEKKEARKQLPISKKIVRYNDIEKTAFGIINRYVCFYSKERDKDTGELLVDERWQWFIEGHREKLKLTTKPKPYDFETTNRWLINKVAPSMKVALTLDIMSDKNTINEAIRNAKLSDKYKKVIAKASLPVDEVIMRDLPADMSVMY